MISRRSLLFFAPSAAVANMEPKTLEAYDSYVKSVVPGVQNSFRSDEALWVDHVPARLAKVRSGEIVAEREKTPDIKDGLIHYWIGAMFMPGISLDKMRAADQNYAAQKVAYAPDVMDSKVLSRQGQHFKVFLRLRKEKVITVILDTVHDVDYEQVNPHRLLSTSVCRKVQEVKDAGTPSEKVLPVGEGMGFLWAMDSVWRMTERDGGLYVTCDSINLSRDLPLGLGGALGPMIRSMSEDSLIHTLESKRRSVGAGH